MFVAAMVFFLQSWKKKAAFDFDHIDMLCLLLPLQALRWVLRCSAFRGATDTPATRCQKNANAIPSCKRTVTRQGASLCS